MKRRSLGAADIKVVDNTRYKPKLVPVYVLLGMVDDYLGRSADRDDDLVERFYPDETAVAKLFMRYARRVKPAGRPNAPPLLRTESSGHMQVVSKRIKASVEAYFDAPVTGTPWSGRTSMELSQTAFPKVTYGRYRPVEMDPRFSYLYGAYLRYGRDEPFEYELANSVGRVRLIKQFLTELDAEWVSHKFWVRTVPTRNQIAFEPAAILGGLLRRAVEERRVAQEASNRK